MSVLVKGMEMPEKCNDCFSWNCPFDNMGYEPRPEHCPLLHVQPHGRLIDAERLKEVFHRNVVGADAFDQLFDAAPTVIPAEEGE